MKSNPAATSTLPYRPCVGIMVLNEAGLVWAGRRIPQEDSEMAGTIKLWQMPQGGIDPGEDALEAAWRELWEETGVARELAELVAEAPDELFYDLPEDLAGRIWKGKWRGQRQRWFLFRFLGEDGDVNIETAEPEFRAWRWAEPKDLPDLIVPFKRALYKELLTVFGQHLV